MATEATQGYARRPDAGAKFRKPNQTRGGRQRQQMIDDLVAALGGPERVTALLMRDIARVADLMALCEQERAKALRGEAVSIANLSRLEGSCDRAVRRLRLPPPNAAAPVPTLAEYLAQRTTDEPEAGDT